MGVLGKEFEKHVICAACGGSGRNAKAPCLGCKGWGYLSGAAKLPSSSEINGLLTTQVAGTHYKDLTPQPVEVIESWSLGYHLGCAIKYIARAGRKPGNSAKQDIDKAVWFLKRYAELAEVAGPGAAATT